MTSCSVSRLKVRHGWPPSAAAPLLAWNEYLYQFMPPSSPDGMTVSAALAQFLDSDEPPWNCMMAAAIVDAIPPIAIYYASRRYMAAGLTMG